MYAKVLVKKLGLTSNMHFSTPLSMSTNLSKDTSSIDVEKKLYRRMIGSLLLLIASHLDISFSVGACAHLQSCLKESHLAIIKRIISMWAVQLIMVCGICLIPH